MIGDAKSASYCLFSLFILLKKVCSLRKWRITEVFSHHLFFIKAPYPCFFPFKLFGTRFIETRISVLRRVKPILFDLPQQAF